MIFVSFKSLTIDQKKSACDLIAAIRYIEEANNNIQINPTNLTSDKDLFIMELWDSKIEGLLRKRIPIFFNKEKMYEEKYSLKYVRTPFGGGKCLDVINKRGEKLYSIPIFIG